jgi:hypothetical protein
VDNYKTISLIVLVLAAGFAIGSFSGPISEPGDSRISEFEAWDVDESGGLDITGEALRKKRFSKEWCYLREQCGDGGSYCCKGTIDENKCDIKYCCITQVCFPPDGSVQYTDLGCYCTYIA